MIKFWIATITVQLIGYLVLSRTFAYVGIPSMKIFIGEIVLGLFFLLRPRDIVGRLVNFLVEVSSFNGFAYAYLIFLTYGFFELARGIANEYPALTAAQNLVFNYYPLYIFLGLFAGSQRPAFVEKLIPVLAWLNGIYGLAYLLYLGKSYVGVADDVGLFGQPNGTAVSILGLMCFWKGWAKSFPPLLLNALVLVGMQVRSDWLSCMVAVLILSFIVKRVDRLIGGVALVTVLLAVGLVTDIKLPGSAQRGGDVSVRSMAGRILSSIDVEQAKEYNRDAKAYEGTVKWRQVWWRQIWDTVHASPDSTFLGLSYGYPLSDLSPYLRRQSIRTPHSVFFYALGYGGWFGVVALFLFQSQIGWLAWRSFRMTGQPFALVVWVQLFFSAFFGNVFETPLAAIPFYLLMGLSFAPLLPQRTSVYSSNPQLASAAGW